MRCMGRRNHITMGITAHQRIDFRFINWYRIHATCRSSKSWILKSAFTKFRFLERYQRDVSLTKEQNHDSRRSPRAHNFVLSSGISAMSRSQKNRISIRAARSAGTQFRFIGRYKRNTLKRTEYIYKQLLTL